MAYKINLKDYLDDLYDLYKSNFRNDGRMKLTCKSLAESVGVTQATISNLNTDSKLSLVFEIAEEIFDYYETLFTKLNKESLKHALEMEEAGESYAFREYYQRSSSSIVQWLLWEASWNGSKK